MKMMDHINAQALLGEKDIVGLDTGFKKLNEMIKGFKNGDLIIVAARPGMGKTTLCLNFMSQVLKNNAENLSEQDLYPTSRHNDCKDG